MFIRRAAGRLLLMAVVLGWGTFGAVAAPPDDKPTPSIELARALIEADQFEKAVAVLKQLDAGDTATAAQIDLMFGRIYLALGKPAKAAGFFEEASFTSLDGEGDAYLGMAEANLALGDIAKARRNAGLALRSDPDLVAAHLVLARADQRLGHIAEANARLADLLKNNPGSEDVAVVMARYRAEQDGPAAGVAELRAFVDREPTAARAWDVLGQMLWAAGRRHEAVEARTTAHQLYQERGRLGRAEAMAVWLQAVNPQGALPKVEGPAEVPSPQAAPRPPIEAAPLPPVRKTTPAAVLGHPEPLPFAPGSAIMTGSGIVLEGGRQIITNRHVIDGMNRVAVRNGTGHVRNARVVRVSSEDDLALLEIEQSFPEGAVTPFADIVDPATGRAAIVLGYPLIGLLGDEQPALTEGVVAKTLGLGNDPNTFQMTAKINKGNSGGPVFDRRGHLLGVAVGKTDAAGMYQKSGTLMEDMNLGIKGGRILHFLGRTAGPETEPPEMSAEELYQVMLPRAVLVAAQK